MKLELETLENAMTTDGAAIRLRSRLQPAGGPGDKIFPATYAEGKDGRKHETKYATEMRVVDGERKLSVLLDSVASQANRMELALLSARRRGDISLPLIEVDFGEGFPDLGRISSLEAPHRVYDAILRDSTHEGEAFRASVVGRSVTDASARDARAMFRHCPTALVFGAWDSTGPRGGMGNKFQRAISSEVVAIGCEAGTKVGSRIDPLQISASVAVTVSKDDKDNWSVDPKGKHRPSEVNHSNIAPSRDREAGGITCEYALHTAVLSVPALRRLKFGDWNDAQSNAARTVLATLGILALLLQRRWGYDFRSRCTLVPEGPAPLELVRSDGSTEEIEISVDEAIDLLSKALATASSHDVTWQDEPVVLQPMEKLVQLLETSRAVLKEAQPES